MTTRTANRNVFIYAITAATQADIFGVNGIDKGSVYCLSEAGMMAVVSNLGMNNSAKRRVRPDRRNIMAHQEVLKFLLRHSRAVLPMQFGIVAHNGDSVKKLLSANAETIQSRLRRVENRVEMGLRVTWDVNNIFEYFVATRPLLKRVRDATFSAGGSPRREEKIELGRVFYRLITDERKRLADRVMDLLDAYCDEIAVIPPKKENEVVNLACLIGRERQESFEQGVFETAEYFNNDYFFNYTGPWAPHSFVDMELRMPEKRAMP